jgi:hypothetical protein
VTLWARTLLALRTTLDRLLHKEINTMSFEPVASVMFAAPPSVVAALRLFLVQNLQRLGGDIEQVVLTQHLGRVGEHTYANPVYFVGAMTLSEAEIALIRNEFRAGGALYDAGARARRQMFPAKEVAAPEVEAGMLTVEVIEELPIPSDVDWAVTRVSKDAFYAELGLPGAPLAPLDPPEQNI